MEVKEGDEGEEMDWKAEEEFMKEEREESKSKKSQGSRRTSLCYIESSDFHITL